MFQIVKNIATLPFISEYFHLISRNQRQSNKQRKDKLLVLLPLIQFLLVFLCVTFSLAYSYAGENSSGIIELDCMDCFGHAINPNANPLCKFGCKTFRNSPVTTKKPVFNSEPSILIGKQGTTRSRKQTRKKRIVKKTNPPLGDISSKSSSYNTLLFVITGGVILLAVSIIILKCDFIGRRKHRVSFVEPHGLG